MSLLGIGSRDRNVRTVLLGVLSLTLYVMLFSYEEAVLAASTDSFLVPIAIAFVFSFVHGAFTSGFWDMLGFKAKTRKEPRRWNK